MNLLITSIDSGFNLSSLFRSKYSQVKFNSLRPTDVQMFYYLNQWILFISPLGTKFSEIFNQNLFIVIKKNAFENVIWKMVAILFWPQYI